MAGIFGTYFSGQNTPEDYKTAYNQTNDLLQNQKNLNKQYTGNAGYNNAINQGLQGAAVTAGQAGQQATQAARNAGMTKGRAANLGASQAANAYGNNFTNQQGMAMNAGNAAINANQGLANQYQGLANLAQSEAQRKFGNSAQQIGTIGNVLGNVGQGLVGLLSDENCKNIIEETDHISKLAEDIGAYLYEYKPEAQEAYPNETNDKMNVGPMAQELEKNPVTAASVETDENGIKHVNTDRLALSEMAIIADLARRLADLEENK